jgi:hypothetical protein
MYSFVQCISPNLSISSTRSRTGSRPLDPDPLLPMPQKGAIALLVRPPRTEAQADPRGPGSPLEHQDREDDAEGQADRGADQE